MTDIIKDLVILLKERQQADPAESYVARLHKKGLNKILEKVGEEATETIIAAKDCNREDTIKETADLWFHTLVMLQHLDISGLDVLEELGRRYGTSGLKEKASRNANK